MIRYLILFFLCHLYFNGFSQKLEHFEMKCIDDIKDVSEFIFQEGIRSFDSIEGKLNVEIAASCSYDTNTFGSATFKADTLFLRYDFIYDSTLIEFCLCHFSITYDFRDLKVLPKIVILDDEILDFYPNRYLTYPVEFDLTEAGDTLNFFDEYRRLHGVHILSANVIAKKISSTIEITHVESYLIDNMFIVSRYFWKGSDGIERMQYKWYRPDEFTDSEKDSIIKSVRMWRDPTKHNNVYSK